MFCVLIKVSVTTCYSYHVVFLSDVNTLILWYCAIRSLRGQSLAGSQHAHAHFHNSTSISFFIPPINTVFERWIQYWTIAIKKSLCRVIIPMLCCFEAAKINHMYNNCTPTFIWCPLLFGWLCLWFAAADVIETDYVVFQCNGILANLLMAGNLQEVCCFNTGKTIRLLRTVIRRTDP